MGSTPVIRFVRDKRDQEVAYAAIGSGPKIVCPCWWVSHVEKDWALPQFQEFFGRLAERFTVVIYDRPGVGLSKRNVTARSLADECELLRLIVSEVTASESEPIDMLAISCGVPIALSFASFNPDRVGKLCCYGGFLRGSDIATEDVQQLMLETIRTHWGLGSRALADIFVPEESRVVFEKLSKLQRDSATAEKAAELLELTYAMDATSMLTGLPDDTLIVHRLGDRAIPCEAGRKFAAAAPGTRMLTLPGSAHPPWFGDKDVIKAVFSFFTEKNISAGIVSRTEYSAISLDKQRREFVSGNSRIPLTPLEFRVLERIMSASGSVVSRDELLSEVWQTPFEGSNKVDALMRNLRHKIGDGTIATVRGHGYRYMPDEPT